MERGVVALPFEIKAGQQVFKPSSLLNTVQLNYFALYWDKISILDNSFIGAELPNEKVFIDAGLLSRPQIYAGNVIDFNEFSQSYLLSQLQIADKLRDADKTVSWSIHQIGDSPLILADGSVSKETVRLELENLLPVPGAEVGLHEILEFKHRRNAELQALHSYCDELYFEIISSGDPRLQAAKSFSGLKNAIKDLEKLNAEGWRSPLKFDLDISPEFDLTDCKAGFSTILNAFHSPHFLETISLGTLLSVAEGFVKLRVKLQSVRKGGNTNLAYISKGRREGIYN